MVYRNAEDLFPTATQAWRNTVELIEKLLIKMESWSANARIEEVCNLSSNMKGNIEWRVDFDESHQNECNDIFSKITETSRQTLDILIGEIKSIFRSQWRQSPQSSEPRFPLTDDIEILSAHFEDGHADGLPESIQRAIALCQPLSNVDEAKQTKVITDGFRTLLDWETYIFSGGKLGINLQSGPLETKAKEGTKLVPLGEETHKHWFEKSGNHTAINFSIVGANLGDPIRCHFLKYSNITPGESKSPNNFEEDLHSIVVALQNTLGLFAHLVNKSPLAKSFVDRTDVPDDQVEKTIFWIGDNDDFSIQRLKSASKIVNSDSLGHGAEESIESAAATWGLPDFVMRPVQERKGGAVREISDGLVVVGEKGVIIQSKVRNAPNREDLEKERRWALKQIDKANSQVSGTARRLRNGGITVRNGRDREISFAPNEVAWVGVIIIENPAIETLDFDPPQSSIPCLVIYRADWEFLFDRLRSTYAVVQYLFRVNETSMLGSEAARYLQLAYADQMTTEEKNTKVFYKELKYLSTPMLPFEPMETEEASHRMVRNLLEDIALSLQDPSDAKQLHSALSAIDALPVTQRSELGHLLLEELKISREMPQRWRARRYFLDDGQLAFGIAADSSESRIDLFHAWAKYRHYQYLSLSGVDKDSLSTCVLLSPSDAKNREWDTSVIQIQGELNFTNEELSLSQKLFDRENSLE